MRLTLSDIKIYKDVVNKIDALVKAYYDEFICCNPTYRLINWEIMDDNTIRIIYSYEDYHGYTETDDRNLTLDEFNGDMDLFGNKENIFYRDK